MSTFRDILSDFESANLTSPSEVTLAGHENSYVLEKPDISDPVDGLSRWCKGCEEYWPLEGKFFSRAYSMPGGYSTLCKACVDEMGSGVARARLRIPANTAGPLTLYFPEATAKACASCERVYPYLSLFWHRDEAGVLTDLCASCKPITTLSKSSKEDLRHAL